MIVYYDARTGQRRVTPGPDKELEAAGWVEVDPEPDEFLPEQPEETGKAKKSSKKE